MKKYLFSGAYGLGSLFCFDISASYMERYGSSLSLNIPHDHLHGGGRGEQEGCEVWMDGATVGRTRRLMRGIRVTIVSCESIQFAVL